MVAKAQALNPHEPVAGGNGAPGPAEIRGQLRLMLASPAFLGSRRCQQFLEFATEKTLAGETSSLKEKNIAIEVFGRDPRTDLADDTIVRVSAREVRKRLAQYVEGDCLHCRLSQDPRLFRHS